MKSAITFGLVLLFIFGGVILAESDDNFSLLNPNHYFQRYEEIIGRRQIVFSTVSFGDISEPNPEIRAIAAKKKATVQVFDQFKEWLISLIFKDKTLAELIDRDTELKLSVLKYIFQDFQLEEKQYPDGQVEITIIRKWNGTELAQLLDKLYRELVYSSENLVLPSKQDKNDEQQISSNVNDNFNKETGDFLDHTGIIIDTRGLQVRPSMAPKIFDEKRNEVYGTMSANIEFVIEIGIIGYAYTMEEAITNPRIGEKPLIVEAIERTGNAKDQVIISLDNANLIRIIEQNELIFKECRVMFIIDDL